MCEFTQREYGCGHFRFIAARWCNHYRVSHRRCTPDVAHFEFRQDEMCGFCQPHEMPVWFHSEQAKTAPVNEYPATLASTATATSTSSRATSSSSYRSSRSSRLQPKAAPKRPPIPLFSSAVENWG